MDKLKKEEKRKEFSSTFNDAFQKSKANSAQLSKRLYDMINYAIGRVDYYERYRTTYQAIAVGMVSGALAIASFLIKSPVTGLGLREGFYVTSSLSLLVGGLGILLKYSRETSPHYPYRDVADIRSWYYIYNVPKPNKRPSYDEEVLAYCEGFKKYIGAWLERASDTNSLVLEDMEQVYILFQLQDFKRKSAQRMAKILLVSSSFASVLLALGLFFDQISWLFQAIATLILDL